MPTIAAGFIAASLQRSATLDQIDDQNDNRNNEQEMNESAQCVGADQSKQPEHKQDNKYCPEHRFLSVKSYLASREVVALRLSKSKILQRFYPTYSCSKGGLG
jgi:hypothetical protein